jgi:hypothetical protein
MGYVTRFQVMATLQAARALALGLNLNEAKSWGLNRALFYAAAKRSWQNAKAVGSRRPIISEWEKNRLERDPEYSLGNEKTFVSTSSYFGLLFKFGDRVQTAAEFDHQIKSRFDDWETAWKESMQIIRESNFGDLESQHRFYHRVYEPRRDLLAKHWSELPRPKRAKKAA